VKIRGYRIELGEIETVLMESGLVSQAVVLAKEDKEGQKRLVGYVVPAKEFDKQLLTSHLHGKLPGFMVPGLWIELDTLPLTPNGKVDKKALAHYDSIALTIVNYVAPRSEAEKMLAAIWQELLKIERIGINDNFFELGGHSLLAMRVISAIRREMQIELPVHELFIHPTIGELAGQFPGKNKSSLLPPIEVLSPRPARIPLSFSQERLWFIDRLEGSIQYHLPVVLRLKGNLDRNGLETSIREIVNRHEVLRTVIRQQADGQPGQFIMDQGEWKLDIIDGSNYNQDSQDLPLFDTGTKQQGF
jgi:acyl carrier protein